MVFKTDIATYSVSYRDGEELKTIRCKSFAAAAGCASALDNKVRLLNVEFSNVKGDSSISGTLYIYSKDNTRRAGSTYLIKASLERNGL